MKPIYRKVISCMIAIVPTTAIAHSCQISDAFVTYPTTVEPSITSDIASIKSGIVDEWLVSEGDNIDEGEALLRLRAEAENERLSYAQSHFELISQQLKAHQSLARTHLSASLDIKTLQNDLESARLVLKEAELDLQNLEVIAPFSGTIESQLVETGEFASSGEAVARVIGNKERKVRINVFQVHRFCLSASLCSATISFNDKSYGPYPLASISRESQQNNGMSQVTVKGRIPAPISASVNFSLYPSAICPSQI